MNNLDTRKTLSIKMKVSTRTIRRMELKGMPVIKIGGLRRYDPVEVDKWISLTNYYKGK